MLAVEVELLTGRYTATRYNDRDRPEWPPHPARLFSAAVAAWADAEVVDEGERAALEWWEGLGAPEIACSWERRDAAAGEGESADRVVRERAVVTHYVPDNDIQVTDRDTSATYRRLRDAVDAAASAGASGEAKAITRAGRQLEKLRSKAREDSLRVAARGAAPDKALQILPGERLGQARTYPTVVPAVPRVTYVWPDAPDGDEVRVLDGLLARIGRLGHSSTLVSVGVVELAPTTALRPDPAGTIAIRAAASGQLAALVNAHAAHQGVDPRTLPAEIVTYAPAGAPTRRHPESALSGDWLLLTSRGRSRLTIRDTLAVARAVRGSLMRWAERQPPVEAISGHRTGGAGEETAPSEHPHAAYLPLPYAGVRHADGTVQGVAIVVPRGVAEDERGEVLSAIGRWLDGRAGGRLDLGRRGVTELTWPEGDPPWSASARRWRGPSDCWLSATPIALDRHPGPLFDADPVKRAAAEIVAERAISGACAHIGLPPPVAVTLRRDAPVTGSRPVAAFPPYVVRNGRLRRMLVHAEIVFGERVLGPVVLGAGRYFGYGLCVPAPEPRGADGEVADAAAVGTRDMEGKRS